MPKKQGPIVEPSCNEEGSGSLAEPCSQEGAVRPIQLNTELHARLLQTRGVKASTYASAMAALDRLRRERRGD